MAEANITSLQNPRVKYAVRLRSARERTSQRRFLIDGGRELLLAVRGGIAVEEAFVCRELFRDADARKAAAELEASPARLWEVTPAVFEKLAFGARTEGVLAIAVTPRNALADLRLADDALVAVLEGIEKPGNIGAVLRSADGAGVAAVVVADGGTDLYNPNAIRASLGTIFTLPVRAATTAETLAWLRKNDFKIVAARLHDAADYTTIDFRGRVAIALGSEATGLSPAWQATDIAGARLPQRGAADSLNVSAAAAVLFYEALRQRAP